MELFIVRHGHSPFTAKTDHQRILSDLGELQANQTAKFISLLLFNQSAHIISSDAQRTWSTANIIQQQVTNSTLSAEALYYQAQVGDWCDAIFKQGNEANLILVGHNPTLSMLAQYLLPSQSFQFKPACVAHFSLEIAQDGLKLPAQLNSLYMPDAIQ